MNRNTRILAILLAVSFGMNLFIAGLWTGGRGRMHDGMTPHSGALRMDRSGLRLGALFKELPPELKAQLQAKMRANQPLLQQHLLAEREALAEAQAALIADPFVPALLAKALSDLRTTEDARRTQAHMAIIDIAQQVTKEQRAAIARGLERMGRRGGARKPGPSADPGKAPPEP